MQVRCAGGRPATKPGGGGRGGGGMASRFAPTRITRSGRRLEDTFFKQAKDDGYLSRAAYKLLEIQEKHRVVPPGGAVLDLGCHPGAWLQVACQALGPPARGGLVLGVDLLRTEPPPRLADARVQVVQADVRALGADFWAARARGFDAVLSDMCHSTHGNSGDALLSLELARAAYAIAVGGVGGGGGSGGGGSNSGPGSSVGLEAAAGGASGAPPPAPPPARRGVLRRGGSLVMKLLQGEGSQEFAAELKASFATVKWFRPRATRPESREVFLLGLKRL